MPNRARRSPLLNVIAAAALIPLSLCGARAEAQDRSSLGLAAGVTLPLGELDRAGARTGINLMLTAAIEPERMPVTFRADGMWSRFGVDEPAGTNLDLLAVIANVSYSLPLPLPLPLAASLPRVYVIAGAGGYNWRTRGRNVTNGGVNVGLGAKLPVAGLTGMLEARLHQVFSDDFERILPISVGLSF